MTDLLSFLTAAHRAGVLPTMEPFEARRKKGRTALAGAYALNSATATLVPTGRDGHIRGTLVQSF
jgi:hypothetical protein